jgi:hypothetical protein
MTPKVNEDAYSKHRSDVFGEYLSYRDHRTLLSSSGHRFRDGRWIDGDSPFHVYRERERPGLGSYKTAFGGKTYRDFASYPDQPEDVPFDWRLGVARSFSSVYDPSFDVVLPDPEVPSVEDFTLLLNDQGTDFIRKYRPGNPVVNLGQFFGELHQLPRLPIFLKSRTKHFSDLGSEYLNVEFGWKPFVKDLIAAYKLQQTISARLERLRRDNGLAIRKRSKHRGTEVLTDSDGDTLTKPFGDLSDLAIGGSDKLEGYHVLGPFPYWFSYDPLALQGLVLGPGGAEM